MDVDEILSRIGGFGYFQKRQALILGTIIFILTFQPLVVVFIGAHPSWKCKNQTGGSCQLNGTFSQGDTNFNDRCNMNRTDWQYTDEFTSIVTEWDLVCGKEALASLAQSILFIGWIPGAFLIGRLSDRFGRTRILFPAVSAVAVAAFVSSFVHALWLFLLLRAVVGFFQGGVFVVLYVLSTEFVGPDHRSLAGTLNWIFFTLSLMVLDGMAYGVRDWRHLSIAVSAPALPLIILWWWVPESCRWNLVHKKETKAKSTLKMIAELNGKELNMNELNIDVEKEEKTIDESGEILDLFRPRQQLMKTLVMWFAWFTNSMVYYGVTLSSGALGGSLYLNFFLTSLVEVPANIFAIWFMNLHAKSLRLYGRKRALAFGLVLASLFCVLVSAIPQSDNTGYQAIRITGAVLGKFCISISFCTIYVASAEILPTVIRRPDCYFYLVFLVLVFQECWHGSMAVFDQIGASIAPFVILLDQTHPVLPFGVMGLCALLAGLFSLIVLPETLGQPTLETLADRDKKDEQQTEPSVLINPNLENTKL